MGLEGRQTHPIRPSHAVRSAILVIALGMNKGTSSISLDWAYSLPQPGCIGEDSTPEWGGTTQAGNAGLPSAALTAAVHRHEAQQEGSREAAAVFRINSIGV